MNIRTFEAVCIQFNHHKTQKLSLFVFSNAFISFGISFTPRHGFQNRMIELCHKWLTKKKNHTHKKKKCKENK